MITALLAWRHGKYRHVISSPARRVSDARQRVLRHPDNASVVMAIGVQHIIDSRNAPGAAAMLVDTRQIYASSFTTSGQGAAFPPAAPPAAGGNM